MESKRRIMLIIGILIIIIMSSLIIINKDSWFTTNTEIKYPDGCIEEYKGTTLITKECTEGRRIVEENKLGKQHNYTPKLAIAEWNLTL